MKEWYSVMLKKLVFNKKNTVAWLFLVLLSWISSIVAVAIPYIHQIIIDRLTCKEADDFYLLLVILLSLYVFEIVEGYFYDYRKSCFQEKLKTDIRIKINEHALHLKHYYFVDNGTEKLISRYTRDTVTVARFYGEMVIELLGHIVMLVAVVYSITRVNFGILILSLVVIALYFVMTMLVGMRMKREVKNFLGAEEEALGGLTENCNAEILVKIYGLYERCKKKFVDKYMKAYKSRKKMAFLSAANTSGARLILYVLQGVVFIVAGIEVLMNRTSVGELVSTIECQSYLLLPFCFFGQFNSKYQEYVSSKERIEEMFHEELEVLELKSTIGEISKIEIKNLSFSYQNDREVLKNVSLSMEKGMITGIIGRSGAGKSTFINLLLGIYMPPEGSIFVNGKDLCELSLSEERKRIGYVPQESIFLMNL